MVEVVLGTALAAIGAGVAVGMAGLGSGIGQGIAAAGSVGAVAEDADMFARGLIFTALPETQAIYGFLIAILLLVFSGIMGAGAGLTYNCWFSCNRSRCSSRICRFRFRYGSGYHSIICCRSSC